MIVSYLQVAIISSVKNTSFRRTLSLSSSARGLLEDVGHSLHLNNCGAKKKAISRIKRGTNNRRIEKGSLHGLKDV